MKEISDIIASVRSVVLVLRKGRASMILASSSLYVDHHLHPRPNYIPLHPHVDGETCPAETAGSDRINMGPYGNRRIGSRQCD